jgi:signal peptidase II
MEAGAKRFGPVAATVTVFAFYALDQVTKWLAIRAIPFETGEVTVIPGFFSLVHWGNTGAAFSSFSDKNAMFIGLSLATLIVIGVFAMRGAFQHTATRVAVSLLSAGVLGNVRFANPWPAFNVADSCICIAACVLIASSWMEERSKR